MTMIGMIATTMVSMKSAANRAQKPARGPDWWGLHSGGFCGGGGYIVTGALLSDQ
jgi:hypothetical protein